MKRKTGCFRFFRHIIIPDVLTVSHIHFDVELNECVRLPCICTVIILLFTHASSFRSAQDNIILKLYSSRIWYSSTSLSVGVKHCSRRDLSICYFCWSKWEARLSRSRKPLYATDHGELLPILDNNNSCDVTSKPTKFTLVTKNKMIK